jgi:hypothetical protein
MQFLRRPMPILTYLATSNVKLPSWRPGGVSGVWPKTVDEFNMSFTSIPILDLALAQDPATKRRFLSELRHALMEVGFLYLKNVGISDEFFKQVIEEGKAFFDIPEREKYGQNMTSFEYRCPSD